MTNSNKVLVREQVSNVKRARGFIFVLGLALISLAAYLFISNQAALPIWGGVINGVILLLGLFFAWCSKYAKPKTITLLEKLMVGWP